MKPLREICLESIVVENTNTLQRISGVYRYSRYSALGRFVLGIKKSGVFLLIGLALSIIPGEIFFYALFFLIVVPYEAYAHWRLALVSEAIVGSCPTCVKTIDLPLEPAQRTPIWKYCPHCDAPLKCAALDGN